MDYLVSLAAAKAAYLTTATLAFRELFAKQCDLSPNLNKLHVWAGFDEYNDAEGYAHEKWEFRATTTDARGFMFVGEWNHPNYETLRLIGRLASELAMPFDFTISRSELEK